jgi:serine/threonine protein kinase
LDLFETSTHYYIVIELCTGGDMYDYLEKRNFRISEQRAWELATQIGGAVYYLHNFNIIHRDLKLENIMMTNDTEASIPKVVDFGLAALVDPGAGSKESVGTVAYAAPEIFLGQTYDMSVDIWSLGTIFFGLLGGYLPYDDEDKSKIMDKVLNTKLDFNNDRWKPISSRAKKLVMIMLEKDKKRRATI